VIALPAGEIRGLSTQAFGTFRRDLIRTLGEARARGLLLRFGWTWGQEAATARGINGAPGRSDLDWLRDGPRLHAATRMAGVEIRLLQVDPEARTFRMEGTWLHSVEAREHLRHFGAAAEPTCWVMTGFAGGYASTVMGRRILFREVACVGMGDEACQFVGLPAEEWGLQATADAPLWDLGELSEDVEQALRRLRSEHDQLQHVIAVHEQLTHVVARGAGAAGIAEALGRLLGCGVAVYDRHLRPLARFGEIVPLGECAESRPDLRRQLARLQRDRRPLVLSAAAVSRPGGASGRASGGAPGGAPGGRADSLIVAPIILGEELLGFLTMGAVKGLAIDLVIMVAERAALTCGLELLRARAAVEGAIQSRGEFLDHLLSSGSDPAFLERWAHHLGLNLAGEAHRIIVVKPGPHTAGAPQGRLATLHWRFHELLEAGGIRGLTVTRTDHVVALVACSAPAAGSLADDLSAWAAAERQPVRVGVSREFQGAAEAAAAYRECRALLGAVQQNGLKGQVVRVDSLGAMQFLLRAGPPDMLRRQAAQRLGPLIDYDRENQTELLPTLSVYLENACSLQATAERLNISVSGLKYRLQRIREVGGLDLDDPEVRFDAQVSLRLLSLAGWGADPAESDRPKKGSPSFPTVHKLATRT